MRTTLLLLTLIIATAAHADPTYTVLRRDWFNNSLEEQAVESSPVSLQGGPQGVGAGMTYSWDLASDPGELYVWVSQTSHNNSSLHTHREGTAKMKFTDVVFSNGSGSGGIISVRIHLDLGASVQNTGIGVSATLSVSGSGGSWGSWYAEANAGAATSTGVFTGLDAVNEIDGVFTSNPFNVTADVPTTVEVTITFAGTAQWASGFTTTITEALGQLNPAEVFVLPAGYTANSTQAGIVDNTWAPTAGVAIGARGGAALALRAHPNPFRARTAISFELAAPGPVQVAVFDIGGRRVRELFSGARAAGRHELFWDGTAGDGRAMAPGVYLAHIIAGSRHESRPVLLVR